MDASSANGAPPATPLPQTTQGARHICRGPTSGLVMMGVWLFIYNQMRSALVTEPSLPELEAERDRLYAQLSAVGNFRRGSLAFNLPGSAWFPASSS